MFRSVFITLLIGVFYCFYCSGCTPRHTATLQTTLPSPHKKIEPVCYYLVKKGDSLWRIAQQYNISIDSLKRKNEIIDPAQLKAGQLLVVPDFDQDQNQGSSFVMPVKGKVVSYFGEVVDNRINKGIKIELTESQKVLSAMAGEVVFAGAINGYGQTVIIEHCDNISTVYSHLTNVEVTQGDFVAQGQSIGDVQSHPQKGSYLLHFEVRKGQTATDPLRYVRHYEQ